jgi:hypothetical protein
MKIDDGAGGTRRRKPAEQCDQEPKGRDTEPAGHGEPVIRQAHDNTPGWNELRELGNSSATYCRYCGSEEDEHWHRKAQEQPAHYQVVVACASCGHAFAALSRN